MNLVSVLLVVLAFMRAALALPLYLFDWLCHVVAFAFNPYAPHGPNPRLGGQPHRGEPVFTLPGEHEPWLSEARAELELVHRGLVILRPKQPYVQWAKRIIPEQGAYTLAKARRSDTMAFLMPSDDLSIDAAEAFVDEYWPHFFAQALESWSFDAATCERAPRALSNP